MALKRWKRAREKIASGSLILGGALLALTMGSPAAAQELQHTFTNPSFGGNPFYSEHLRAIADIHRPEAEAPEEATPTPEELLVAQLQAQLTSSLSSQILRTIQNAKPGDTGEFVLGEQRIAYSRTASDTVVTFANATTGETRQISIPANGLATGRSSSSSPAGTLLSPEQALMTASATGGQSVARLADGGNLYIFVNQIGSNNNLHLTAEAGLLSNKAGL